MVGDAGFESGTSAPEVWCTDTEPPHLKIASALRKFQNPNLEHGSGSTQLRRGKKTGLTDKNLLF